jgi:hypothetical protein
MFQHLIKSQGLKLPSFAIAQRHTVGQQQL